ncbi:P-loop containing nucleoside triphosphate hydrolase protein [Gigaspora rosea]|uniref:P-loop containing nucleoside triphosphate hydrolase protein n=1 Tax=Gigaspora rosea TaxID=44941 RepID=A0A397VWA9_9GLOM|nr:P-loop containing nucleoside triphosphate hydrolase protein [Gigaspora rosea]
MKHLFKVLFVGETGVGKSTLINVLTNYFRNGNPDNIKIAVKSQHLDVTEKDLEHSSSEFNVNDQASSQTSGCFHYDFEHPEHHKYKYRFIDSPGLSDTKDQDQRNLELIAEKAIEEKYLNAIVFVLNGTQSRYSELEISYQIIDSFLNAIKDNEFKSTEDFQKIAELQRDLNAQILKAVCEISKINGAIFQLLNTRYKRANNEDMLRRSENYTRMKVIEFNECVRTPHKNIICMNHLDTICHENCPNCHDLQKYKIGKRRQNYEEVITELKDQYEELLSNSFELKTKEKKIISDLEFFVNGIESHYNSIKHDIESLKLMSKLNFDKTLRSTFNKLRTTAENITDKNLKT